MTSAKDYLCKLCHMVFGFLCVVSYLLNFILPVVIFMVFFVYELSESLNLKDKWFDEETREFAYGMVAGIIILFISRLT